MKLYWASGFLGVLSGLLMVGAMAPVNCWPLIFVGLVPMVYAQYRLVPLAWCWIPVSLTAMVFSFGAYSRTAIGHATWWAVLVPLLVAVVAGLLAVLDRTLSHRWAFRGFVMQMPVWWTGLDALRQNFALVGNQGYLPYALTLQTRLIEPVSVFGIFGLELLILLVNYAIALMVLRLARRSEVAAPRPSGQVLTWSSSIVAAMGAAWCVSGFLIYDDVNAHSGPSVRVAAIQPGSFAASLGGAPTPEQTARVQETLSNMTREAAKKGAQLVVWPEEVLPYDPTSASPATRWLKELVRETNIYLVTGYLAPLTADEYSNRAALIGPDGHVFGTFTKAHQAPFDNDVFAVGTSYPSFPTPLATIGIAICFDYEFQHTTRYETLSGANLIAAPALQFGTLGSMRESDKLVFNAVEARVPAVSADLAWTSIIVRANGEIVSAATDSSVSGSPAVLVGDVQIGPRDAPYLKWGNWVGAAAAFATAAFVGYGLFLVAAAWVFRLRR